MVNSQKDGEEDFLDSIWKKLEFHKGAKRPKQKTKTKYPTLKEGVVEEEIIPILKKTKKRKKPIILIPLILLIILTLLFVLSKKEEITETSSSPVELKIPTDYIAYWKFDDNTDETRNYPARFEKNSFIYSDILRGKVLKLDGTDDYVNIGDCVGLENIDKISISMWIKSKDVSHTIIGKELIWKIDFDSYKLRFLTGDNWENPLYSPVIDVSEWTHVLATHNSSRKCFYINGNLSNCVETPGGSFGDNAYSVIIGAKAEGKDAWEGLIDDVMIYNRSLEETEIKSIYELQKIEELPSISPFAKLWDKLRTSLS